MALYLDYRPKSFADVVGQDHIVTTLEHAVSQGRISHAYLLSGTRGTGKTSVARILARTILLAGIEDGVIRDQMIKAIDEGTLVDLIEIDAASNRRIDDVRDLIEKVGFSPSIAKTKVYIIDEVHMLTKEAFNALLKTLEEPPPYAYFVLATTELHKVPDTIQSRCQRFLFKRVKDDDLISRLQYIVNQERIPADREALRVIARHASGSFRDGIALLDQLRSLTKITAKDVTERIGNTVGTLADDLFDALMKKDSATVTEIVRTCEEAGIPLDLVATGMLERTRDELHKAIDAKTDIGAYLRITDALLLALRGIRLSPVPALALESALLSLCSDRETAARTSAPREAKHTKTEKAAHATPKAPETVATVDMPPAKQAEKPTLLEAEDFTVQNVLKHWDAILKSVTPPSVRMSLKNASVSGIDGLTLQLSFPSAFHMGKVSDVKAARTVEEVLSAIFKQPIRLKFSLEADARPSAETKKTNLAEAAAEVFGGF